MSWKCKNPNCDYQIQDGSILVTNGYCPKCNKNHQLIRFDPLTEQEDKKDKLFSLLKQLGMEKQFIQKLKDRTVSQDVLEGLKIIQQDVDKLEGYNKDEKKDIHSFIDEFQTFLGDTISKIKEENE